jgi:cytochrome c biogenesis protein CcdA
MNLDRLDLMTYYLFGVAAFFNPCGVALLPAYVSHYIAKDEAPAKNVASSLWRGLEIGALVSIGFFVIFGLVGVIISLIGIATANRTIFPVSPWTALSIGIILILMGIVMLMRRTLPLAIILERMAARFQKKESASSSVIFYFFYGLSYAIASCGCAMPLFASMLLFAFSESSSNGILIFGAYAWGMTSMMLVLSLLTVTAKALLQKYLRASVPAIQVLSGLVMIGAGIYLVYEQLKLLNPDLLSF